MSLDAVPQDSPHSARRTLWRRLWDLLTQPCPRVVKPDDVLRARLLASLLAFLISLGFVFVGLPHLLAFRGSLWEARTFWIAMVGITLLCVSYVLSRTRFFRIGSALAISVVIVGLTATALVNPDLLDTILYFFLIPVLLGSLVLPERMVVTVMALCLSLVLFIQMIERPDSLTHALSGPFSLVLIVSAMILMLAEYRSRLEQQRRQDLAASEQRYRMLVEQFPEMIAVHREGIFEYINPAGVEMLGAASPDAVIGRSVFDIIHPDDHAAIRERIFNRQGNVMHTEVRMQRLDGKLLQTEGTGIPLDYRGKPAIQIIVRDVTERRQAEQEMRHLRSGIEQSGEAIFMTDTNGQIVYVNPAFERIYGYTRDEAIGQTPRILKSGLFSEDVYASFWSILLAKEVVNWQITNRRKDGSLIEVDATASPVLDEHNSIIGFLAIQHDITARREAENEIKQAAARLELLHRIDQAILAAERPEEIAAAALAQLRTLVPFVRASVTEFHIQEQQAEILAAIDSEASGPGSGERVPLDIFVELDQMRQGQLTETILMGRDDLNSFYQQLLAHGICCTMNIPLISREELIGSLNLGVARTDVFTSKVREILREIGDQLAIAIQDARLRASLRRHTDHLETLVIERTREVSHVRERVEAILDNSPDSIILIKPGAGIETGNRAFIAIFGYLVDEIYHQPLSTLANSSSQMALTYALESAARGESTRLEIKARRKDGSMFDADVALVPIREGQHIASVVCSLRDISNLKEVERMREAFVSNVSHELRTPITSLKLFHELLVKSPARQDEYLSSFQRELTRLERIVEDLLTLSRIDQKRIPLRIGPVDLNALIANYFTDRSPMAESRHQRLSFAPADDLPPAHADWNLVGQVLSILLTNALSYTPAGGAVHMVTHPDPDSPGEKIGFTIYDTGPGIAPAERSQIFDRFFRGSASRESNAPGTGLGLAIAREIIELQGGRIEVDGPQWKHPDYPGACFTIWLHAIPANGSHPAGEYLAAGNGASQ